MTAYEFDMKQITFMGQGEWAIKIRDGDTTMTTTVYDDDVQASVRKEFDYISDTVADELRQRAGSLWDKNQITDEEKAVFIEILGKVIG